MTGIDRGKLLLAAAVASFAAAASHSIATAQSAPPAPAPLTAQNLKVLPATIPQDRLFAVMKNFSQSLGVRCTHCHVGEEGQPVSTFDFASDAKPAKDIARAMMRMTRAINEQHLGVTDFNQSKVTCYTCHRGAVKPLTAAPPPPATTTAPLPTPAERG